MFFATCGIAKNNDMNDQKGSGSPQIVLIVIRTLALSVGSLQTQLNFDTSQCRIGISFEINVANLVQGLRIAEGID